jgi:hypothetical protein
MGASTGGLVLIPFPGDQEVLESNRGGGDCLLPVRRNESGWFRTANLTAKAWGDEATFEARNTRTASP